jgi:hypothetical protein
MPYQWLQIDGVEADLPEGNGPLATLDMNARTITFKENVTLKAKSGKTVSFGDGIKAGVKAVEVTFTEDGEAGVYTGSVVVPAGALLLDVIVHNVALWDAGDSAVMDVGDVDPNGLFDAIDLQAGGDLLAGESCSFSFPNGVQGVYIESILTAGTPNTTVAMLVNARYLATERTITGVITTVGVAGSAGRTRMIVVYVLPETSEATFVET